MDMDNNDIFIDPSTFMLQPAKGQDWERKSYTGIMKPTVFCDYESGSQLLHGPPFPTIFFPEIGMGPMAPSGYATVLACFLPQVNVTDGVWPANL